MRRMEELSHSHGDHPVVGYCPDHNFGKISEKNGWNDLSCLTVKVNVGQNS